MRNIIYQYIICDVASENHTLVFFILWNFILRFLVNFIYHDDQIFKVFRNKNFKVNKMPTISMVFVRHVLFLFFSIMCFFPWALEYYTIHFCFCKYNKLYNFCSFILIFMLLTTQIS